jgi:hypothetical protein
MILNAYVRRTVKYFTVKSGQQCDIVTCISVHLINNLVIGNIWLALGLKVGLY